MRELYVPGERLKDGQSVIIGKDGKLYKTGTIALFKEPKRPVLVMPKGTLKEVKVTRKKKEPKNLSKEEGTFMTAKTQKAREDRQKLLRSQRPQVVVNGGFDPKVKQVNPGKIKPKKVGQDDEEI